MASDKSPPLPSIMNALYKSKTDARIMRLNKILSTSGGVDTTLTLVGYSLFFAASQLSNLRTLELKLLSRLLPSKAGALKNGAGAALLKLADLETSMKLLAGMCSDFRTFTRLWGLLGVYAMVKRNYLDPPKDAVLNAVSWTQAGTLGLYYFYENGYYLAGKGVLRGWAGPDIKRWAKTSLKMFLAYVLLEYVRLYRARQLLEAKRAKAVSAKDKEDVQREEVVWLNTAIVDVAYTPLGMHWASENGMMGDGWVGGLMTVIGAIKFKAAWAMAG